MKKYPSVRAPRRFRERVVAAFTSGENAEALAQRLGWEPHNVSLRIRRWRGRMNALLDDDPHAQRGGDGRATTVALELRRLNDAFLTAQAAHQAEVPAIMRNEEDYLTQTFLEDQLAPPGLEHFNRGPLWAVKEERDAIHAARRGGSPPGRRAWGGPASAGSAAGMDNAGGSPYCHAKSASCGGDGAWMTADPNRSAADASAAYYASIGFGQGQVADAVANACGTRSAGREGFEGAPGTRRGYRVDLLPRTHGRIPPCKDGKSLGAPDRRAWRHSEIPFWQITGRALDQVDRDVGNALGSQTREDGNLLVAKGRWPMHRLHRDGDSRDFPRDRGGAPDPSLTATRWRRNRGARATAGNLDGGPQALRDIRAEHGYTT